MEAVLHRSWRRLPPRPSSVGEARRMVRGTLSESGLDDLVDTAELLVSEVVTNALVHAGTPIDVEVAIEDGALRVAVGDGSNHLPSRRDYGPTAGTGRGLLLLDQMVDGWGVEPRPDGKSIWFRLSTEENDRNEEPRARVPQPTEAPGSPNRHDDDVRVQLLDVPVVLCHAWHQHAEALLREHLLATLDEDLAVDVIQRHADATDALSVLFEHIPPADMGQEPGEAMSRAAQSAAARMHVEVPVPSGSVAHFRILDEIISRAVELADHGELLTFPTQPELRVLREWLCQQVLAQSEGGQPAPWTSDDRPAPPALAPLLWDPTPVAEATDALVAADDTNQILAVSGAAAELLGYDSGAELVGRRLLTIIPARFHEAHLAGFTLHFLTGRQPLLGQTVTVPARRRDDTEVDVRLTVDAVPAPQGRKVFVARMERAEG